MTWPTFAFFLDMHDYQKIHEWYKKHLEYTWLSRIWYLSQFRMCLLTGIHSTEADTGISSLVIWWSYETHVIKIALFTKIKSTLGHSYFIFTRFTDLPTQFFRVMKINLMIFLTCFILFSGKFMSFHKGFLIYNESGSKNVLKLPWLKHFND